MIQRSRFAKLSVKLSQANQKEISNDVDGDSSQNIESKVLLKNIVQTSSQQKDLVKEDANSAENSPMVKSPGTAYRRDLSRIQQAENEGFLKKSRFNSQKQFEERKNKLQLAFNQKEKIDMKDPYMQNLAVEISVKAIKTYAESQFLLKLFSENSIFHKQSATLKKNTNFVNQLQYKCYPKHSIIYETGDFGQYYYFLLQGKLYQLLPTNEDIVQSPLKISNFRGPSNKPTMSLLALINCNQKDINSPRTLSKSMSKDLHRSSIHNTSGLNNSFQVDKEFQQYVPHHKFNQQILPGTGFGDSELFSRQRRGCTIYCEEDSHVLSINKEQFDQIMGEEKQKLIDEKNKFFTQFQFLEGINTVRLMNIIDTSITLKLTSKNIIYTEGSDCDSIYFIRKGEVHLQKFLDSENANEQNDPQKKIYDEGSDLHKAMNRRKKKQERVPILILGENSYFGDYEILKKHGERVTQAICTSQECEIIEVKADKLMHLVKVFGKFQFLIKNEEVRDEFMKERIELIQTQKQEQMQNRLVQGYSYTPKQQSITNQEPRIRQYSLNALPSLNQGTQHQQQPIILKSDNVPKRIKAHTLSVQLDDQQNIFQKSITTSQTPSLHRKLFQQPFSTKNIEDQVQSNSSNNSPARSQIPRSERVISDAQPVPIQQIPIGPQSTRQKSTTSHHYSPSYDFSIQETKGQIMDQIKQSQIVQDQLKQPNKQSKYVYKKFKSSSSAKDLILPPSQKGDISSNNESEFQHIKNDFNKNLFQTFVENAEKQVLQKQAIMQKLQNNKQTTTKASNDTNKAALFEEEFSKGFNNMYLRKFGKKYEKK